MGQVRNPREGVLQNIKKERYTVLAYSTSAQNVQILSWETNCPVLSTTCNACKGEIFNSNIQIRSLIDYGECFSAFYDAICNFWNVFFFYTPVIYIYQVFDGRPWQNYFLWKGRTYLG